MLRVWLIVMFAGAGGMVVGSLASTHVLGIRQDAPVAPVMLDTAPRYASKQAHDRLFKSVTRDHWVDPDAQALRAEYVSVPGKGPGTRPGVAVAVNGGRTPQNGRTF